MDFIKLTLSNGNMCAVNLDKAERIEEHWDKGAEIFFSKKDSIVVEESLITIFDAVKQIEVNTEE